MFQRDFFKRISRLMQRTITFIILSLYTASWFAYWIESSLGRIEDDLAPIFLGVIWFLANILFLVGLLFFRKGMFLGAALLGSVASLIGVLVWGDLLVATCLWEASMVLLAVAAWIRFARTRKAASVDQTRTGLIATAVVLLYFAACLAPAVEEPSEVHRGYIALAHGWGDTAWYANLLFFAGLVFLVQMRFRTSTVLGGAASLLAFTTWSTSYKPLIGYYLWHTSILGLAVGAWWLFVRARHAALSTRNNGGLARADT